MEPTLILVTQRDKQSHRGAYSGDDCCQTFDPIQPGETKFAVSRKRPDVLRALLKHNFRKLCRLSHYVYGVKTSFTRLTIREGDLKTPGWVPVNDLLWRSRASEPGLD